jgi:hypothetical protein
MGYFMYTNKFGAVDFICPKCKKIGKWIVKLDSSGFIMFDSSTFNCECGEEINFSYIDRSTLKYLSLDYTCDIF